MKEKDKKARESGSKKWASMFARWVTGKSEGRSIGEGILGAGGGGGGRGDGLASWGRMGVCKGQESADDVGQAEIDTRKEDHSSSPQTWRSLDAL